MHLVRYGYELLLVSILISSTASAAAPAPTPEQSVVRGVDQAEANREAHLTGYSVTEHYNLQNSRFHSDAEMTVATVYSRHAGKIYQTLAHSGSAFLQRAVLDKLLVEEAEMSRGGVRQHALVTSANYKMKLLGQESLAGRLCDILEITPRTKGPHLLKGRAWVDATDHTLVRIAGKPTASLSFWAGHPMIVRDYQRIDGYSLATHSSAVSDSLLLGKSELTIDYLGYTITEAEPSIVAGPIQ